MPYNIYDDKGRKIGEVRSTGESVVGGVLGVLLAFVIGFVIFLLLFFTLFLRVAHDLANLYLKWASTFHHVTPYQELNAIITIAFLVGISALIFVASVLLTGGEGIVEKKGSLSKAFEAFVVAQILMYFILIGVSFLFAWPGGYFPLDLESKGKLNLLFIGTQVVVAITPLLSLFRKFARFSVLIFMLLEFLVSCSALSLK